MSEKIRLESMGRIESAATLNLDMLDQAQRFRGEIPDDWLARFNRDLQDFPVRHEMYKLASREMGKGVPDREHLYKESHSFASFGLSHFRDKGGHVVRFYGTIGKGAGEISSDRFHDILWGIPDDEEVTIRFNSPGGDYKHSLEMADTISKRSGVTRAIVDGQCASGASIACMRCSPIGIGTNAYFMIHFARVTLKPSLTADDLDIATKKMRQTECELVAEYKSRWKGTTEDLIAALDEEREFAGHEAVYAGLADYVDENATVANRKEIENSVKSFTPEKWHESERKNFAKYRVAFERWKHAATCMAKD